MPTAKTEYKNGPDGYPARVVGPWVDRKTHYVDNLASIFATGMKNKWPRRAYVELFAGPGLSWDRKNRRFVEGSALRALRREFTDFAFVDVDAAAVDALEHRIAALNVERQPRVLPPMDCSDAVPQLRAAIPARALTLAFIDPTTWQVRLDTIGALSDGRSMDLLVTFHIGAMKRVAHLHPRTLNEFFGTAGWREILRGPQWQRRGGLAELYNRQLEQFGYVSGSHAHRVPVSNTRGALMYELIAFSKNPVGIDFWRKAMNVDERGQRGFWE